MIAVESISDSTPTVPTRLLGSQKQFGEDLGEVADGFCPFRCKEGLERILSALAETTVQASYTA